MQRTLLCRRWPAALRVLLILIVVVGAAISPVIATDAATNPSRGGGPSSTSRILIHYQPGKAPAAIAGLEASVGAHLVKEISALQVRVLEVPDAAADNALAVMRRSDQVDYAERDVVLQAQDAPVGGTSSVAPVVAGIARLLFSANTALTNTQVEQALVSTAVPASFSVRSGRVDALAALASLGFADPQPPSAPFDAVAPQVMVETNGDWNYQPLAAAPQVGQVLLRGQGSWTGSSPMSLSGVQWQRCDPTGVCTAAATAAKYTVQATDSGYGFRIE
ncbi:MAG: hypothetical protein E6I73_03955 [Chloroflexi bacterium]|nr:MAG: hypothetical protein E6I73_03955 [Chloroflexota bacterium]